MNFLRDATPSQLEQAAAQNHRELFFLNTIAEGGEVITNDGLEWTYAGKDKQSMIPFPSLTEENAGDKLDAMMNYFRQHPPKNAGCWSLVPSQPSSLDIKLLARGFQTGWQPSWMSLDLEKINTNHPVPTGLVIKADNESGIDNTRNLPYAGKDGAVSITLMQKQPDRVQRFIATLNGDVVGHSCVFFSTGEYAVAGIYNVGVVPMARQQGIGKAVVTAASQYAKEKGYRYATLNGTGKKMYEQIGFEWISFGRTWWLMNNKYITHPPSADQVAFAEAIGLGDIDTLKKYEHKFNAVDFSKPTNNGMILMQLAVHGHQQASAEWLISHGAACSVLDAWDLHWENRAEELLKKDPSLVNHLYGETKISLLHIAAERNDIALAELSLSANPDLTIKDRVYQSTPLGWAEHLGKTEIVRLIKKYMESNS